MNLNDLLVFDVPALLSTLSACMSCALLGAFLVLRRQSLMGDALAHSVLPGIVVAFIFTGTQTFSVVFIGAAVAALLSAILITYLENALKLASATAMGVVFSCFYALGIFLMEIAAGRNVDLDPGCLLYGQLEGIFWSPPSTLSMTAIFMALPHEVYTSLLVLLLCFLFVSLFFKELRIVSFDPELAYMQGVNPTALSYVLMFFVAIAIVISFQVLGSILVIAMLICPGISARFFTDKLAIHLLLSVLFSIFMVIVGYGMAVYFPRFFGLPALNAAGGIALFAGFVVVCSALFAPLHGVVSRTRQQKSLALKVLVEDMLGFLYRLHESGQEEGVHLSELSVVLPGERNEQKALRFVLKQKLCLVKKDFICLTERGLAQGAALVRTHRLWEGFLVTEAGLRSDHVHDMAMEVEHYTSDEMENELERLQNAPEVDPHGKPIPKKID